MFDRRRKDPGRRPTDDDEQIVFGPRNVAYNLIATINHDGPSANSGHYISVIVENGRFLICDDSNIVEKSAYGQDFGEPYVLIYQNLAPVNESDSESEDERFPAA